jgi:hypothetical protein
MAVLEMLPEMICSEELFGLITLAELVNVCQVINSAIPVRPWTVGKFFAAISTNIARKAGWTL